MKRFSMMVKSGSKEWWQKLVIKGDGGDGCDCGSGGGGGSKW